MLLLVLVVVVEVTLGLPFGLAPSLVKFLVPELKLTVVAVVIGELVLLLETGVTVVVVLAPTPVLDVFVLELLLVAVVVTGVVFVLVLLVEDPFNLITFLPAIDGCGDDNLIPLNVLLVVGAGVVLVLDVGVFVLEPLLVAVVVPVLILLVVPVDKEGLTVEVGVVSVLVTTIVCALELGVCTGAVPIPVVCVEVVTVVVVGVCVEVDTLVPPLETGVVLVPVLPSLNLL